MNFRKLGTTDIEVSTLCLGTMTWGEQNNEIEAHQQLDYSFERGINFIDTAEMYPVPPQAQTYAATEKIIGNWSKLQEKRSDIILATKMAGPGMEYIRGGVCKFNKKLMAAAVDSSLERLKTDYIDLYQLHWPERTTNYFGNRGYKHNNNEEITPFIERLEAMQSLITSGKVRHFGVSNETPWGVMKYLSLAETHNLPRIASIQNPYNLLNRTYEIGLSEMSIREKVGLLAYSPLGFGVLTGKYMGGQKPAGARLTKYERFSRYSNPQATKATELYDNLAKDLGISLTTLALSYVTSRNFLTSNIIGATNLDQLKENIDSIDFNMTSDIETKIDEIQEIIPNPSP